MPRPIEVKYYSLPRPPLRSLTAAGILPWSLLNAEARPIVREFVASWEKLLQDRNSTEHDYHKFIAGQPAFFFQQEYQVVSKPELGSEHQADFVLAADQMSKGIHYRFVEIESPHAVAYKASGNPSARLTHAVQQVMDWKRWIKSNRARYKKLFPSSYVRVQEFDNLSYCIYIGRRDQSSRLTALRNEYAKEFGIEIRSFDSFMDRLRDMGFQDLVSPLGSEGEHLDIVTRNRLANPFLKAYAWGAWKDMVLKGEFDCRHFLASNATALLKHRSKNSNLRRCHGIWKRLSEAKRKFYLLRVLDSC
jgi:hypothetical protein